MPKSYKLCLFKKDDSIEIAEDKLTNTLCFMFHPERFNNSQVFIDNKFKSFFNLK